ncbi:MAG: PDZ domain-containing protein [Phycisphaeraceae bacterium]|nr:PDZ domain-containing protein [Phycisphaeraceae bacterium]
MRCIVLWIVGILLSLAAVGNGAIDEPSLLRDLQSPDYAVREEASHRMLTDEAFDQPTFLRLYASASLPEQRERILDASRHHFLRVVQEDATKVGGASSMGLTLLPMIAPGEVAGVTQPAARVGITYPGFPAYAMLRPGDLILSLDGREVPGTDAGGISMFIEMVKAHPLARSAKVGVLRDGKRIEVTMRLASRVALQSIYQMDGETLRPELAARWAEQAREFTKLSPEAAALQADLPSLPSPDAPVDSELDAADDRLMQLQMQLLEMEEGNELVEPNLRDGRENRGRLAPEPPPVPQAKPDLIP